MKHEIQTKLEQAFLRALQEEHASTAKEIIPFLHLEDLRWQPVVNEIVDKVMEKSIAKTHIDVIVPLITTGLFTKDRVTPAMRKKVISILEHLHKTGNFHNSRALAEFFEISPSDIEKLGIAAKKIFQSKKGFVHERYTVINLEDLRFLGFSEADFLDRRILSETKGVLYERMHAGKLDEAQQIARRYHISGGSLEEPAFVEAVAGAVVGIIEQKYLLIGNVHRSASIEEKLARLEQIPNYSPEMFQQSAVQLALEKRIVERVIKLDSADEVMVGLLVFLLSEGLEGLLRSPAIKTAMEQRLFAYLEGKTIYTPSWMEQFPGTDAILSSPRVQKLAHSRFLQNLENYQLYSTSDIELFRLSESFLRSSEVLTALRKGIFRNLKKYLQSKNSFQNFPTALLAKDPEFFSEPKHRELVKKCLSKHDQEGDIDIALPLIGREGIAPLEILAPNIVARLQSVLFTCLRDVTPDRIQSIERRLSFLEFHPDFIRSLGLTRVVSVVAEDLRATGRREDAERILQAFQISLRAKHPFREMG